MTEESESGRQPNSEVRGPGPDFADDVSRETPSNASQPVNPEAQATTSFASASQATTGPVGPYGEPVGPYGEPVGLYGEPAGQPPQPYQMPTGGYDRPYGYGAQPSYGVPNQGYGVTPYDTYAHIYNQPVIGEHPQATTVLIMGILGFFITPFSFVAWYMGGNARKQIEAGAPYRWDGGLQVGYWMGKVLGIITLVGVALFALMMVIMMFGFMVGMG